LKGTPIGPARKMARQYLSPASRIAGQVRPALLAGASACGNAVLTFKFFES